MFSSRLASFAVIGTLVGSAAASFQVLSPGGSDLWWVANSQNVLAWSCKDNPPISTAGEYIILLNNTDITFYHGPTALLANVHNSDCSEVISASQSTVPPGKGYTVVLADMGDETKVYAVSQPFEIKALGASYPATSATPTDTAGQTGGTASSTSTGSSSSTSPAKSNGAFSTFKVKVSTAGVLAAIGAAIGML